MKKKNLAQLIIFVFIMLSITLFVSCSDDPKTTEPKQEEPIDTTDNPPDTTNPESGYAPLRFPDSPFPVSVKPDTLFVVYTNEFNQEQILTIGALQGILAQTKPRIYMLDENEVNGYKIWLEDLAVNYQTVISYEMSRDLAELINHFKSEISGYILSSMDELYIHSAISLAGIRKAIVVTANNEHYAKDAGLSLITNTNGMGFSFFINKYGSEMSKSSMCYQTINMVTYLTDYAVFGKMFHMYEGKVTSTLTRLGQHLNTNAGLFGWIDDKEPELVKASSELGIFVHAANWSKNLSALSNYGVETKQKTYVNDPDTAKNRHTVCFLLTDGDNLGWLLKDFYTSKYNVTQRGKADIGWTMSPAMCELAPTVLKYYYDKASSVSGKRDYFVAGPSGVGYMNPDHYTDNDSYAALTAEYMKKSDMRILNIIGNNMDDQYLTPYTKQDQIDGILYYYYTDYALGKGSIKFVDEKPVITARYNLWPFADGTTTPLYESSSSLAAKLNAASTDITTSDSYTLVAVHIWTQGAYDIMNCIVKLNKEKVRVVAPDEFVALVKKNVAH